MTLPVKATVLAISFLFGHLLAQNETSKWYFGWNAALDFSTNPPTALNNSTMSTLHGSASIADAAGTLLFYTDGYNVYNSTHSGTLMANGSVVGGSATQSPLIIKKPGSATQYYLFTLSAQGFNSNLAYSIVDMSLAAGFGSVTVKNSTLATLMTQKLTATQHSNGHDFWVLTHKLNSNEFWAYPLSSAGVSSTAVISQVGSIHANLGAGSGYMKISPNRRKVGLVTDFKIVELFDFDPSTGQVSNALSFSLAGDSISELMGCEFSPDGSKFYTAGLYPYPNPSLTPSYYRLLQWDLCAGSGTAITASQYTVNTSPIFGGPFRALQLASNGKVYLGVEGQSLLSAINNPNNMGAACNFSLGLQSIGTGTCKEGLPNFMGYLFKDVKFNQAIDVNACAAAGFTAPCLGAGNYTGVTWDFGDPGSASTNTSNLFSPNHVFTGSGTYTVTLVMHTASAGSDTIKQTINFQAAPNLTLAGKQNICEKAGTTLTVSGANSYSWSTGASSPTMAFSPTVTTVYTVTGTFTNHLCTSSKVVTVSVFPCTGIYDESEKGNLVEVYPNPNGGLFMLKTSATKQTKYTIYNLLGEKIQDVPFTKNEEQIDISHFPSGIYMLVVYRDDKPSKPVRIIKE